MSASLLDQDLLRRRQLILGRAVMINLVEVFEQVHAETLQQIAACAGSRAFDDLRRHAHTLKGAAAALGMEALMASADLVEHAAQGRDAVRLDEGVRDLQDLFHTSLAELRAAVE